MVNVGFRGRTLQGGGEHPELAHAEDFPEVLLGFQEPRCCPAHRHVGIAIALHTPRDATYRAVGVLDEVGRRQPAPERRRQAQLVDRERFLQPFEQRRRGIRVLGLSHAACVSSLAMPSLAGSL